MSAIREGRGRGSRGAAGCRCLAALLLVSVAVAAHGGGHIAPAAPSRPKAGLVPPATGAPPVFPGPAPSAPARGPSSATGAARPAAPSTTGRRGASRGATGRTLSRTGSGVVSASAEDQWEFWWEQNNDRLLALRSRLVENATTSGGPGVLTGRGRRDEVRSTRRPGADEVRERVVPALRGLLARSADKDVLDSAVLALARVAREDQAGAAVASARPLLGHPVESVATSAALSLGVLGSPSALPMLRELLADSTLGRRLVGGGEVPRRVRAYAALGLGLLDDADDVGPLLDVLDGLGNADRDVRAAAVVGLGLMSNAGTDRAVAHLVDRLDDRDLDPVVASYVPTALGKLGDRAALPALLAVLEDRDAHRLVRQSAAVAIGRLATLGDRQALQALRRCVEEDRDGPTRHYALISLAKLAVAAGDRAEAGDTSALVALLVEQMRRPDRRDHRSWAALAAGLVARARPAVAEPLRRALADGFEEERDPSFQGAFAIGLGLAGERAMGPRLLAELREKRDADLRGHLAEGLGLLGHEEAAGELRALCADEDVSPGCRLKAAVGLALLRDDSAVEVLIAMLRAEPAMPVREAATRALGLVGDEAALQPLLDLALDEGQADLTRAFACVALGILGEKTELGWNVAITEDNNYLAHVEVLDQVLRIL